MGKEGGRVKRRKEERRKKEKENRRRKTRNRAQEQENGWMGGQMGKGRGSIFYFSSWILLHCCCLCMLNTPVLFFVDNRKSLIARDNPDKRERKRMGNERDRK